MPVSPPAGVTPVSTALPDRRTPFAEPPVIRADLLDYQTQEFASFTRGFDPIDAQVVEALWRVRGTGAAVVSDGARFNEVRKLESGVEIRYQQYVREALSRLTSGQHIRVVSIRVRQSENAVELVVDYTNLRLTSSDKSRQARRTVPIGEGP